MTPDNRFFILISSIFIVGVFQLTADAQIQTKHTNPATGETYNVELVGGFWAASPEIDLSSDSLGITGADIDFVSDLGLQKKRFREFRLVLRPAQKHKFRIQYVPIGYQADTTLERPIAFQDVKYDVKVPVSTSINLKAWRFGYEYDFIYRNRGFLGVIVEAKYADLETKLKSVIGDETIGNQFTRERIPIPAVGGIGRIYPTRNLSLTVELTGFRWWDSEDNNASNYGGWLTQGQGQHIDLDMYGTANFSDTFGIQAGYHTLQLGYVIDEDSIAVKLSGPYLSGVLRF